MQFFRHGLSALMALTLVASGFAISASAGAAVVSAASPCTVFGTDGNDTFIVGPGALPTDAIICGGKGNDTLDDVPFSFVTFTGTFYGGPGDDSVGSFAGFTGTFYGGPGNNTMVDMIGAGTFYGGPGNDSIGILDGGTFYGGPGVDSVFHLTSGLFEAARGDDSVTIQDGGTYDGGPGSDTLTFNCGGTQISVESVGSCF